MGSYKPVLPPGTGMFTTNPGPVWAQVFAQHFGFAASPANQGGNDYALRRRARDAVAGLPASGADGGGSADRDSDPAVAWRKARLDSEGDLFRLGRRERLLHPVLAGLQAGQITSAQVQAALGRPRSNSRSRSQRCTPAARSTSSSGNVPGHRQDCRRIAGNPGERPRSPRSSSFFNTTFFGALNAAGRPDDPASTRSRSLNEVVANPAAYGFSNVTTPACGARHRRCCARRRTSSRRMRPDLPLRRRRPPDDRGARDHRAGCASR